MATTTYLCFIFVFVPLFLSHIDCVESSLLFQSRRDDNTTDRCNDLMEEFASHSSNFEFCTVTHARPIKICQKCVNEYQNVTHIYKTILQSNNTKGKSCQEILLNADRLGILQKVFSDAEDLWTRGHCESCFVVNKTTGVYQLSNYTQTFIGLHSAVMACIQIDNQQEELTNRTVCQDCEADYCSLNTFYNKLKDVWDDAVCMDIVDSMNKTRNLWSGELKCINRQRNVDAPLIATVISVSLIPVIFYLGAKIFSSQTRNQLQAQKRLSEHFRSEEENNKPSTSAE